MEEFELKLRISPSDTQFKKQIGPEKYDKIRRETFQRDRFCCQGCGFQPLDEKRAFTALTLHVIEINEENFEESKCNTLCMACHSTQHIDVAIEQEWVQLVNSSFSQKSLIEQCRINSIHQRTADDLRRLKIEPSEFLAQLKAGVWPSNTKAKVIFTNKFEWGDL